MLEGERRLQGTILLHDDGENSKVNVSVCMTLGQAKELVQKLKTHHYRIYKDGNQWCAVGPDFVNLQESDAGFGSTPQQALSELLKENYTANDIQKEGGS